MRHCRVTQAPALDVRRAGERCAAERSLESGVERGRAERAQLRIEALQDREVGRAVRVHAHAPVAGVNRAAEIEQRVLPGQHEPCDLERVLLEREPHLALVVQPVVEERELGVLVGDAHVHDEIRGVEERAFHVHRATHDRAGVGRHLRREEFQIRIERRVEQPQKQRRIAMFVERDAAGSSDLQTIRDRIQPVERQHVVLHRQLAVNLADAFVAGVEVGDRAVEFVARRIEPAVATRLELQHARERRLRHFEVVQRFDRHAHAVHREHVGAVPADPRVAGDFARSFRHDETAEPHPVAFEAEVRRGTFKRLAPRDAGLDLNLAGADELLIGPVQQEISLRQRAIHRPVAQPERRAELVERPAPDGDPAVHFLFARLVAKRVPAVGPNRRAGRLRDEAVLDVHEAVFDDDLTLGAAPDDAPRAHIVGGELAGDARGLELLRQLPVERAAAADLDRAGRRIELRHDAGEEPIACLPVVARDVEGHLDVAADGMSAEAHEFRRRRGRARTEVQAVRREVIVHLRREWKASRHTRRIEFFFRRDGRRILGQRLRRDRAGWRDRRFAFTRQSLAKLSVGPGHRPAGRAAGPPAEGPSS